MFEDSTGWDCATMGNLTCGAGSVSPTQGYHDTLTYYGLPDTSMLPISGAGTAMLALGIIVLVAAILFAAMESRR